MPKKRFLTLLAIGGICVSAILLLNLRHGTQDVEVSGSGAAPVTTLAISGDSGFEVDHAPPLPPASEKKGIEGFKGEGKSIVAGDSDELMTLIPAWLRESGELRREQIEIDRQPVERVRGRYEWAGGELVEIEVSDLGVNATVEQFKSLGFDLDFEESDSADDTRLLQDGEDYAANMEFSEEDREGSMQVIVGGRYLMEIQMEGFPFEAFQAMEDRDAMVATLKERVQ